MKDASPLPNRGEQGTGKLADSYHELGQSEIYRHDLLTRMILMSGDDPNGLIESGLVEAESRIENQPDPWHAYRSPVQLNEETLVSLIHQESQQQSCRTAYNKTQSGFLEDRDNSDHRISYRENNGKDEAATSILNSKLKGDVLLRC